MPLINGKSYEWSDCKVLISGLFVVGITKVTYEEKQNKMNVYGSGSYPVSFGNGSKEATCSLTLKFEEVNNIRAVAPLNSLLNIPPFDIVVAYIDASLTPVKHKIRNCRFMNDSVDTSQGDQSIDVTLEILPSHIEMA